MGPPWLSRVQIMECFQNSMGLGSEGQCHSYTIQALAELWGRCALLPQCVALTIYPSEKGQYGKQKCIVFMVQSDLTIYNVLLLAEKMSQGYTFHAVCDILHTILQLSNYRINVTIPSCFLEQLHSLKGASLILCRLLL